MSLDLSHTNFDEMLKQSAKDFMRREAPKLVVEDLLETDTGYTVDMWKKLAQMGWLGIIIPEQYGGTENSMTSAGLVMEALGSGPLPGPYFSSSILGSHIILETASEKQKQEILPQIAEGKIILTLALTEPDFNWKPRPLNTIAENQNSDFVLNGIKLFIYDAKAATHFIIAACTKNGNQSSESMSLFLVDSNAKGVSVRRLPGFLSGRAFEVKLDSVKVSRSAMLGNQDEGWPNLKTAIFNSIPALCAYKVGGCQAVFDMALEYSRSRVQFGRPIGRFQRVQDMIIEMVNQADAARWTTYEALWKLDTQRPASKSVHLSKAVSSEAYWQICTLAHQVFSGLSYSKEHPISFHTRTSRYLYNYLGDPASN